MLLPQAPTISTPDTPPPPYWERLDEAQVASVEFVAGGDLYHVDDDSGQNYRIAEGWCSIDGIDWEDEHVPASVFQNAVDAYAKKNPTILWDHKRDQPIGVLMAWEVDKQGLFVRFRILDERDFDDPENSDLLRLCNQTWSLIKRGLVRGLSWNGRARKRFVWSSELGKYIKQPVEILMSEITVTPIQVGPGAKITGVNTLSKALEICKALTLGAQGEKTMDPKMKAAIEAQKAYLASLGDLPDGAELPKELLEIQEGINKAMGVSGQPQNNTQTQQPTQTTQQPSTQTTQQPQSSQTQNPAQGGTASEVHEAITKALAPLQQQVQQLNDKVNGPGPLRNRVGHDGDNPTSTARPGDRSNGSDFYENVSKALHLGGDIRDGKLKRGTGERSRVSGYDLMGMSLVAHGAQLNWKPHLSPDISFGKEAIELIDAQQG